MAFSDKDLQELALSIEKSFEKALRGFAKTAGRSPEDRQPRQRQEQAPQQQDRNTRRNARVAKNLGDAQENLLKATEELTKYTDAQISQDKELRTGTFRGIRALKRYEKALSEASNFFNNSIGEYDTLMNKSLFEQYRDFKSLSENTRGLSSKLAAAQKNSSLLAAAFIESHSEIQEGTQVFKAYLGDLKKSVSDLDESYLRQSGLLDETTKELRDNLNPRDFAELRAKIGESQAVITENLSKIGIENLDKLTSNTDELEKRLNAAASEGIQSGEKFRDSIYVIAKQLEAQGHKLEQDLSNRETINYAALAKNVNKIERGLGNSSRKIDKISVDANTALGKLKKSVFTSAGLTDMLNSKVLKPLMDTGTAILGFKKAVDASKNIYKDIVDFNVASVPASFIDVQLASVKMGMSFDETVKFLQQNQRVLALYGSDFDGLRKKFNNTFAKFGYNFKQGAEMIAPAIEGAIATGVNVQSGDALNSFIDDTIKSFRKVAGVVGGTVQQYAALNKELYQSEEVSHTMLGLDNERALLYAQSLRQQRDDLAVRGISLQQAQDMVKAQEAAKKEKVSSRVKGAAMIQLQAQQFGMSAEDAARAARITRQGRAASAEDTKWLTETFAPQFAKARAEYGTQYTGTGNETGQIIADVFLERTSDLGAFGQVVTKAEQVAQADKAKAGATEEQRKAAEVKAAPDITVGKISDAVNTVASVLENNFTKLLIGLGLGFAALTVQALLTARALSALSGAAGAKGIGDTLGDILDKGKDKGKPGGPGGKGGKILGIGGKVLGAAAVGLAGYSAVQGINEAEQQKQEGKITEKEATVKKAGQLGMLGGGGTAAAIGMGVGQVLIPIPGIGAAIGAAVGGVVGGFLGKKAAETGADLLVKDKKPEATAKPKEQMTKEELELAREPSRKFSGVVTRKDGTPIASPAPVTTSPVIQPAGTASASNVNKDNMTKEPDAKSGIVNVADTVTHEKLSAIAESMSKAVNLLQEIIDKNVLSSQQVPIASKLASSFTDRQLPSAFSYITGRST